MDFALVDPSSIGQGLLSIDSVIECKFNYENQTGEIKRRLTHPTKSANAQVKAYKQTNGYVLYLIADFRGTKPKRLRPHDAGWDFYIKSTDPACAGTYFNQQIAQQKIALLGSASTNSGEFFCAIFEA